MLNKDILSLYYFFDKEFSQEKYKNSDAKFKYAIIKNKQKLLPLVQDFEKLKEKPAGYVEYDKKRLELCEKYSEKDEAGKAIIDEQGLYKITNMDAFNKDIDVLKAEYKDLLDIEMKNRQTFLDELEKETEMELYKVSKDFVSSELDLNLMEYLIDIFIVE